MQFLLHPACVLATTLVATALPADEGFLEANVLGFLYHELGHAVIDIEGVPIFGQEEDAADIFSIFLVDALFEPEPALDVAYDIARGFWAEAIVRDEDEDDIAWWGVHGLDEQRFYTAVCIFYGADPEGRADFAEAMELPEARAETCSEEYAQADASWGRVFDEMQSRGPGDSIRFEDGDGSLTAQILEQETAFLNDLLTFSDILTIRMESCGEANAFYYSEGVEIIFCTELEEHLDWLANR